MIIDETWAPPEPPVCTHWTPKGLFKIYSCGDAGCLLFIDKRRIYFHPGIPVGLSIMIASGKIDDLIGFPTEPLKIPREHKDWNNGRVV